MHVSISHCMLIPQATPAANSVQHTWYEFRGEACIPLIKLPGQLWLAESCMIEGRLWPSASEVKVAAGNARSMLIPSCLFRLGGTACLLTNRPAARSQAKYALHTGPAELKPLLRDHAEQGCSTPHPSMPLSYAPNAPDVVLWPDF